MIKEDLSLPTCGCGEWCLYIAFYTVVIYVKSQRAVTHYSQINRVLYLTIITNYRIKLWLVWLYFCALYWVGTQNKARTRRFSPTVRAITLQHAWPLRTSLSTLSSNLPFQPELAFLHLMPAAMAPQLSTLMRGLIKSMLKEGYETKVIALVNLCSMRAV